MNLDCIEQDERCTITILTAMNMVYKTSKNVTHTIILNYFIKYKSLKNKKKPLSESQRSICGPLGQHMYCFRNACLYKSSNCLTDF